MYNKLKSFWRNKKVFITGHTGFKGSWLVCLMKMLGAEIYGYALEPADDPNHYNLLSFDINSTLGDIRDLKKLEYALNKAKPDIVFHLAAQPIVRRSYEEPLYTLSTNIMGTVNLLELCRGIQCIKAVEIITSDKCYENIGNNKKYREDDRLGGHDPYSASKSCVEVLTASYRNSFFNQKRYGIDHEVLIASCRAGNVIGGGDWATDRLIPDIVRSINNNSTVTLRNPCSTRPWQHVMDPIFGYVFLGQKLLERNIKFADAWNFGPDNKEVLTVKDVAEEFKSNWDKFNYVFSEKTDKLHEAKFLMIDSAKANRELKWKPVWNSYKSIKRTVNWYKYYYEKGKIKTESDINEYFKALDSK